MGGQNAAFTVNSNSIQGALRQLFSGPFWNECEILWSVKASYAPKQSKINPSWLTLNDFTCGVPNLFLEYPAATSQTGIFDTDHLRWNSPIVTTTKPKIKHQRIECCVGTIQLRPVRVRVVNQHTYVYVFPTPQFSFDGLPLFLSQKSLIKRKILSGALISVFYFQKRKKMKGEMN